MTAGGDEPIRVVLVDDHRLLRDGVRLLLGTVDGIDVVAEAADGREALAMIHKHRPDVVLADARMPGMDGLELAAACRDLEPSVPVIILTTFDDEDVVAGAWGADAAGFLLKDVSTDVLAAAIRAVDRGERVLDPRVVAPEARSVGTASDPLGVLTRTERVVAGHVAVGRTNSEIAEAMVLAEGTVKNHVSTLLRKLGCRDRTAAALLIAHRLG